MFCIHLNNFKWLLKPTYAIIVTAVTVLTVLTVVTVVTVVIVVTVVTLVTLILHNVVEVHWEESRLSSTIFRRRNFHLSRTIFFLKTYILNFFLRSRCGPSFTNLTQQMNVLYSAEQKR